MGAVPAPESPAGCPARVPTSSPRPSPSSSLRPPVPVASRAVQTETTDSASIPKPLICYPFLSHEEKCLEVGPGVLCRSSRRSSHPGCEDWLIAPMWFVDLLSPILSLGL